MDYAVRLMVVARANLGEFLLVFLSETLGLEKWTGTAFCWRRLIVCSFSLLLKVLEIRNNVTVQSLHTALYLSA